MSIPAPGAHPRRPEVRDPGAAGTRRAADGRLLRLSQLFRPPHPDEGAEAAKSALPSFLSTPTEPVTTGVPSDTLQEFGIGGGLSTGVGVGRVGVGRWRRPRRKLALGGGLTALASRSGAPTPGGIGRRAAGDK